MTNKKALLLATLLFAPSLTIMAKPKGFKAIVKHIETQYGAKRKRIPFLGVANFAVKFVHPAGVKGFGDLDGVYQQVAVELRQIYSLAYSPDLKRDGAFRKISVKVNREGSVAKTRKGYFDK
jgi:RecJ-like exonuclease